MPGNIIAEARNPEGHLVQLDQIAWDHVLEEHVEMRDHLAETMAAITAPDDREPDVRWIRVVTEFSGSVDRIVSAFPQSNDPGR